MPWPDSISLIRESWISQLEFLVNTEARQYQDDGLDGEKGWLSFFFFSYEEENRLLQIIFFLTFERTHLFYLLYFVVSMKFQKKSIPLSKFDKSYLSIFSLRFSFTNYTLEKIYKTSHKTLSYSWSFSQRLEKKLNFSQLYHLFPPKNQPI